MYSCHEYRLAADAVHVNTCTGLNVIKMNVTKLCDEISHTKLLTYLERERGREGGRERGGGKERVEGGREGEREGEGKREREREREWKEGGREREREREKELIKHTTCSTHHTYMYMYNCTLLHVHVVYM